MKTFEDMNILETLECGCSVMVTVMCYQTVVGHLLN